LEELSCQRTDGLFTWSVVIVDNDANRSALSVVSNFAATSTFPVHYVVEPKQNIAMARNRALENATGEYVAFIDDDELPDKNWLLNLLKACEIYHADGVLGPVKPRFEHDCPLWATRGGFFERPDYPTGYELKWPETRTGNVLFKTDILDKNENPFMTDFDTTSEDTDFFRRMMQKGRFFVWCSEAIVHELVPPSRCSRTYLLKRALLRGANFQKHPTNRVRNMIKSIMAVPCYTLFLPLFLLLDHDLFLNYLIKLFDHLSRIASFFGWKMLQKRPG
jgi:succinoglycan biosynthesis protein ExoM